MTPEQVADLFRAQVELDRAIMRVQRLPLSPNPIRSLLNAQQALYANLGAMSYPAEKRAVYDAGDALYDEWYGDRWEEDRATEAKREQGSDRLPQEG